MTPRQSTENAVLAAPIVLFLLAILGFPTLLSLVYGFSETSFETLTSPSFSGLENFRDVLVVVGGTIPADDARALKDMGVAEVFTPGATTGAIVDFLRERVPEA